GIRNAASEPIRVEQRRRGLVRCFYEDLWNRWDLTIADGILGPRAFSGITRQDPQRNRLVQALRRGGADRVPGLAQLDRRGHRLRTEGHRAPELERHPPGRDLRRAAYRRAGQLCRGGDLTFVNSGYRRRGLPATRKS